MAWVRSLNRCGYVVDLMDRSATASSVRDEYVGVFGLAYGGSGRQFVPVAQKTPSARHIALATVAYPKIADARRHAHFDRFEAKYGVSANRRRILNQGNLDIVAGLTDELLTHGSDASWNLQSFWESGHRATAYGSVGLPLDSHAPPRAGNRRGFLVFVGNGLVAKGVDLCVEIFATLPHLRLDICGPNDWDFQQYVLPRYSSCTNIRYHGFVKPTSRKMRALVANASFQLMTSPSEGFASGVVTLMSTGLIPVTSFESFYVKDVGVCLGELSHDCEQPFRDRIEELADESAGRISDMQDSVRSASEQYSVQEFETRLAQKITELL